MGTISNKKVKETNDKIRDNPRMSSRKYSNTQSTDFSLNIPTKQCQHVVCKHAQACWD